LSSIRFGAHVLSVRSTTITITATDGNTFISSTLNVTPLSSSTVSFHPAEADQARVSKPAQTTAAARPATQSAASSE
jgi:hypothetical protein